MFRKHLAFAIALAAAVAAVPFSEASAQRWNGGGGWHGGGWHGGGGGWHGGGGGWHGGGGWGYRGGYYGGWGRHDYAGPALVAGLAGLAIGASLAQPRYYYGPAYGYVDYYGPPPPYYVGPSYYGRYEGCRRQWVWIPRWRTYQLVRACY